MTVEGKPRDKVTVREEVAEETRSGLKLKLSITSQGRAEEVREVPLLLIPDDVAYVKKGEEDLDIGGTKVKAERLESVPYKDNPPVSLWRARIDGKMLVLKENRPKSSFSLSTRKFAVLSLSEDVQVGDKTLACRVTESVIEDSRGKQTRRQWIHESVPGWVVKEVVTTDAEDGKAVKTKTLLEWHAETKEALREGEDAK